MPYIPQSNRPDIDRAVRILAEEITSAGELNYSVFCLSLLVLAKWGVRYENNARLKGVLNDIVDELQDRVFRSYENDAVKRNGDIPLIKAILGEE